MTRAPRLVAVISVVGLLICRKLKRLARDFRQGRKADAGQQSIGAAPLTRADVVHLIAQNGGSSELNLVGCNLAGVDLSGLGLENIVLGDATRKLGANLRNANLSDSVLTGAKLAYSDMSGAYLRRAILRRSDLRWVEATSADLREAKMQWSDLYQASLINANLLGADLRYVSLYLTNLQNAQLERTSLGTRELHESASAYAQFNETLCVYNTSPPFSRRFCRASCY